MTKIEQTSLACLYEAVSIKDIPELRQEVFKHLRSPALLANAISAMAKSGISKEVFKSWLEALEEMHPKEVQAAKDHKRRLIELEQNPEPIEEPVAPVVTPQVTTPEPSAKFLGLKGCLAKIIDSGIFTTEKDPIRLRDEVMKQITASPCTSSDKFIMVKKLSLMSNINEIQKYIFNAFLSYNKLGTVGKRQDI